MTKTRHTDGLVREEGAMKMRSVAADGHERQSARRVRVVDDHLLRPQHPDRLLTKVQRRGIKSVRKNTV